MPGLRTTLVCMYSTNLAWNPIVHVCVCVCGGGGGGVPRHVTNLPPSRGLRGGEDRNTLNLCVVLPLEGEV